MNRQKFNVMSHMAMVMALAIAMLLASRQAACSQTAPAKAGSAQKVYICPPCGQPCDTTLFDKPGICPKCGMKLVERTEAMAAQNAAPAKKVAILIFNGVQIIDFTGPYEMFGASGFDVYTVGETRDPVTTSMGLSVVPKYSFADAPQPDILVVPGGGVFGVQKSAPTLKWVQDITAHDERTMSVCNGAFILASAGLLDGLSATTTYGNLDRLKAAFPKINVVRDQRFVDNGKVITAAGLTAGIDGALHVISKTLGNGTAQQVALGEEYDWHPGAGFVRGKMADRLLPKIDSEFDAIGKWEVEKTAGTADRWEIVVHGKSTLGLDELADRLEKAISQSGTWARTGAGGSQQGSTLWTIKDSDGKRLVRNTEDQKHR